MPLRKSTGNMYPWVTHTHAALGGECPHRCSYCYVENPRWGRAPKYTGEVRLIESEMKTRFGEGKTIFVENCNDLFADGVPDLFISRILQHCADWPKNTYVFQSKNPTRITHFGLPINHIIGTTIETNRDVSKYSKAPTPEKRYEGMLAVDGSLPVQTFVTIEPIMDFDLEPLLSMIVGIAPDFVNIGADSKGRGLPEPTGRRVRQLVRSIQAYGIEIREKHNLERLLK